MSRASRTYQRRQRDAICHAHLIDGWSMAETQRRAVAGELDVPAFDVPYGTVVEIIKVDRDRYMARALNDPAVARATLDAIAYKLVTLADRAASQMDTQKPSVVAIKRVADAVFSARRALPTEPRKPAPTKEKRDDTPETPHVADTLAQLLDHTKTTNADNGTPTAQAA